MSLRYNRTAGGRQVVIVADPSRSHIVLAALNKLQKAVRQRSGRRLHVVMNPETPLEPALLNDPAGIIYVVHQPQRVAAQRILGSLSSDGTDEGARATQKTQRPALLVYIRDEHTSDDPALSSLSVTGSGQVDGAPVVTTLWEHEFFFGHGGTFLTAESADVALDRGLDALSLATVTRGAVATA